MLVTPGIERVNSLCQIVIRTRILQMNCVYHIIHKEVVNFSSK